MPMVKKYPTHAPTLVENSVSPSSALLQNLLNYSKSLETKQLKSNKVLLNMN